MIPYGWGHSGAENGGDLKEAIVFEETAELARSRGGAGASRESGNDAGGGGDGRPDSSGGARSASAAVHVVRPASAPSDGEGGGDVMPVNAMAAALAAAEKGRRPSNYSEIFDESLR